MLTSKLPDGIQVNSVWVNTRSSDGSASRSKKTFTTTRKLAPTAAVANHAGAGIAEPAAQRRRACRSRAGAGRG